MPLPPPAPSSAMSSRPSATSSSGRPRRKPNWDEFYKNGMPKEIIMIHDTPPPSDHTNGNDSSSANGRRTGASSSSLRAMPQSSSRSANPHGEKRIRTGVDGYVHGTPSTTASRRSRTPVGYYNGYSRTPTYGRNGIDDTASQASAGAGSKRKRVTRSTMAAAVANVQGGPPATYWPPQKPIQKSKEVTVEQIHEVRALQGQK